MKRLILSLLACVLINTAYSQFTITGTVTDETDEKMIGATIDLREEVGIGTLTGIDGKYKLQIPEKYKNGTLVFSFCGCETVEKKINAKKTIDANLKFGEIWDTPILPDYLINSIKDSTYWVVKGKVRDKSDNLEINNCTIKVLGFPEIKTTTSISGDYEIKIPLKYANEISLIFSSDMYMTKHIRVKKQSYINVFLEKKHIEEEIIPIKTPNPPPPPKIIEVLTIVEDDVEIEEELEVLDTEADKTTEIIEVVEEEEEEMCNEPPIFCVIEKRESYSRISENEFRNVKSSPISTFSIDVDKASYSNIRRFINNGQKPPADAVKIEEMINYFKYDYPQPKNEHPFSINTEYSECPWQEKHKLLHIGLQGKIIPLENIPASNLVFLIDVSGSMQNQNKLGLLKKSFGLLVDNLRDKDRVSIVVYAGAAGVVLESTSGDNKQKIKDVINKLSAGGSTAGGEGIELAYKIAKDNFIKDGNNRVILATDGDFNVGQSNENELEVLIEEKRKTGIFLTCLGFGMGNYQDSKMETLSQKGNGNYAYIDNLQEAQKVLSEEFGSTLYTIAKDVKIQIEFNPTKVQAYRLIGYENRMLNTEDFDDDKKDAGELGSGHSVTAIYEIIPIGVKSDFLKNVDDLKYQKKETKKNFTKELATVKFRYKKPDGDKSIELSQIIKNKTKKLRKTSDNFRFSTSVALFGMILKNSKFKGNGEIKDVIKIAEKARGKDKQGYRAEFIRLVKTQK